MVRVKRQDLGWEWRIDCFLTVHACCQQSPGAGAVCTWPANTADQ